MRPDRCGTGRPLESFNPVTRRALEDFEAYLSGRLAIAADGVTYVPVDSPDAVHVVERPGVAE